MAENRTADCIEYEGTRDAHGYGILPRPVNGSRRAARAALAESLGRPVIGLVRHTCDNPPCVNPAHLLEGTNADNVADMVARGRQSRGSSRPDAKLTEALVIEMRELAATGVKLDEVAARYGVALSNVTMIVRGHRWRHVGGPITTRYMKRGA